MWKSPNRAKAFKSKNFNSFVGDQAAGQYQIEVKRNPKTELWPCHMRTEIKQAMWKERERRTKRTFGPDWPENCPDLIALSLLWTFVTMEPGAWSGRVKVCRAPRLPDSPVLIPRLTITIRLRVIFTGMSSPNYGPIVTLSQVKCPYPASNGTH